MLFRQLRKQGTPIPTNDMWLAALVLQLARTRTGCRGESPAQGSSIGPPRTDQRRLTARRLMLDAGRLDTGRRRPPYTFKLKVVRGRVMPGVDLCDRDKLFDVMDGR
jgi:hypothetical protein